MNNENFKQAYNRWLAEPFPEGSIDDELAELHAQLAYADSMVAETALPLINRNGGDNKVPQQVQDELHNIVLRSISFEKCSDENQKQAAMSYRLYAELLLSVILEMS